MIKLEIQTIIDNLGLQPHPEGGYFKETYRSVEIVDQETLGASYSGSRNCCTGIYFMLTSDSFSAFHKITQDEMWHFYQGSPIFLHTITPLGEYGCVEIGSDIAKGQIPQVLVPGGVWFAATVKNQEDYSLVGCTVSPGFDFEDFQLADRKSLMQSFPKHEEIISQLTRI